MGFIHSKLRNRLGKDKIRMITFIKNNYAILKGLSTKAFFTDNEGNLDEPAAESEPEVEDDDDDDDGS